MSSVLAQSTNGFDEVSRPSFTTEYAARAIRSNIAEIQDKIDLLPSANINKIAPIGNTLPVAGSANADRKFKIGIVGAGSAGLFTAMIFDHLKENFGLDVEYEILERNGKDRVGGRLYTYHFPRGEDHHYFDVGAMRFPNIAIMSRTFALFRELDMDFCDQREKPEPKKKQTRPYKVRKPTKGDLIPYYLNGPNQVTLFNGVSISNAKGLSADMFGITGLSPDIASQMADDIINHAIHEFTDVYYKRGPEAFWKLLTQEGDSYSVRHFLSSRAIPLVDHQTIEFLETLKYGKGWYDQSFTEMVLQSLDHESQEEVVKWWCVEGGAQEIAKNMAASLKQTSALQFHKRVTAMSYIDHDNDGEKTGPFDKVEVKVDGERTSRIYDAVFNSVPLGAMEHMQLEGLNLNWGTKQAIRNLAYGAACKVGIRFRSMWWVKDGLNVFSGGISKTDLPLRWCVYPSYNIHDDPDKPAVLLASYTWGQEADRLGALINGSSPQNEGELKQLLLHNLARLHTTDDASFKKLLKKLNEEYIDHYAYDWSAHPGSIGAIAYFGPGQFNSMYHWITRSNGKMMIIGEAASSHHAWVVGALDSAVRGVYQFLYKHSDISKSCREAAEAYAKDWSPKDDNKLPAPFGPLPCEYNRSEDVGYISKNKMKDLLDTVGGPRAGTGSVSASPNGELARHQVWIETVRVEKQGEDRIHESDISKEDLLPLLEARAAH